MTDRAPAVIAGGAVESLPPADTLILNGTSAFITKLAVNIDGEGQVALLNANGTPANGFILKLTRSRGTVAVPGACLPGDSLGLIQFKGYDSTPTLTTGMQLNVSATAVGPGTMTASMAIQLRNGAASLNSLTLSPDGLTVTNTLRSIGEVNIPVPVKTNDATWVFLNQTPPNTNMLEVTTGDPTGVAGFTGIAGMAVGQHMWLINLDPVATSLFTLYHQDPGSAVGNQFLCPGAVNKVLVQYESVHLWKRPSGGIFVLQG